MGFVIIMKKSVLNRKFSAFFLLPGLLLMLSGCGGIGDKSTSLSVLYGVTAIVAGLILAGYLCFIKQKKGWSILLLTSVLIVNCGYLHLSLSTSLTSALMANRIAYAGSVLLPLSMFMILLRETRTPYKKRLPITLLVICGIIFAIAASPGILDIYYKEVSFAVVHGVGTLVKVYGPLHPLYLVFLLSFFSAMVGVIIYALVKKTVPSIVHAIILAAAVFVNIGVWFIEQLISMEFEMLSVSYIISELFLLGVSLVANENKKLQDMVTDAKIAQKIAPVQPLPLPEESDPVGQKQIDVFLAGLDTLTHTERKIYDAYVGRATTKEIMASLDITENTLKFHNKNIYSKLGVSSRKELLQIYSQLSK